MVEILVVVFILALVLTGGYMVLASGKATWYQTDVNIQLQENLRKAVEKLSMELRQTQTAQLQILDSAGANNTDVIRFSIPILCQAGVNWINTNGDVANWGAPLTWGCTDVSCSDQDGNCGTLEYKFIEYRINNNQEFVRRVLNGGLTQIREDVFAQNIQDFQVQRNGLMVTADTRIQIKSAMNQQLTAQRQAEVMLRN